MYSPITFVRVNKNKTPAAAIFFHFIYDRDAYEEYWVTTTRLYALHYYHPR